MTHKPNKGPNTLPRLSGLLQKNVVATEVNGYHLIFDLNGVLVVT
jgi:hypothetical protein